MTESIKLSIRLKTVSAYLTPGAYFADIGSDHAYLPCYVCQRDDKARAIAGEVSKGPFTSAKQAVSLYGLQDVVTVKLGDGLAVVDEAVTEVVIAGMGGALIRSIIEKGKNKLQFIDRLILQPNNNEHLVRETFLKHGFSLTDEVIVEDNGRLYEILVAAKNTNINNYDAAMPVKKQCLFGPILMQEKSVLFMRKWRSEYNNTKRIIETIKQSKHDNEAKLNKFRQQLKWIEEVIH